MIERKSVAIIGLGYVGLPLAQCFVSQHFRVIGIDIDRHKIHQLRKGKSHITDLKDEDIQTMLNSGLFVPTSDYRLIREVASIIICVPTPLTNKEPDLSYIISAVNQMIPYLQDGQLIILESSTYPGTTEDVVKPMLEQPSRKVGEQLFLAYSPERVDPGNPQFTIVDIPKIISGVTEKCFERIRELYGQVFRQLVPVSRPRVAEFCKMLENSQRLINISFMNEMNILANKMNVNLWEVIEASSTKPMGFTPYYPSAGIGGHCIPIDPYFLSWVGKREGVSLSMIHQAGLINEMIPYLIVNKVAEQLKAQGIPLDQASIGVIGVTYKKDVNDIRESAAKKIIEEMSSRKIKVSVYDPIYTGKLPAGVNRFRIVPQELQSFDIVLILVDHSQVPWRKIVEHSKMVIDTRNVTRDWSDPRIIRI